ncbi:MAG: DUF4838 domain-containing protein, partial [Clostridia bacterium]|nr:DUF4838 domain-containing protein [Clostridia bacterium]
MLKRILSFAIVCVMLLGMFPLGVFAEEVPVNPFEDVAPTDWFWKEVLTVNEEGIMTGKSATVFDPKANISRAEVVTALARFACVNVKGKGDSLTFPDTQTDAWYSDYVGWAFENGIVTGYDNGNFGPSDLITRQELAVVLSRMIKYLEAKMPDSPQIDKFTDGGKIASWVAPHAETMRMAGLMKGDANGNFNATNNASRAEVATIISRMLPDSGRIAVVDGGKCEYKIVADANESGAVIAAERLQELIAKKIGTDIEITNDTTYNGKKIAIGGASKLVAEGLGTDGYKLTIDGENILIGGEADGLFKAATRLANLYIKNDNLTVTKKTSEICEHEYPIGKLTIQGNDISKYVIKYTDGASKSVVTAANEIQKYIEMACAVKIEITTGNAGSYAIILDDTAFTDDESFSIKSVGNNVVIGGSGVRGVLYGAYTFLDNYVGWRFLDAGVDFLRPVAERDISGIDYKWEPYFEYRIPYYTNMFDTTIAPKLLVNGYTGITEEYGGHASGRGHGCHTFQALTDGAYDQTMQPCLSDPAIFDQVLKNVLKKIETTPGIEGLSVSQNDNGNYCQCEKCMAVAEEEGSQAGPVIRFVNRIAEEVEKVYPDVYIQTLAYQYSRKPPKTVPRHNVIIQLCSIECCFGHELNDPQCDINVGFVEDLKAWSEICDKIYIWDYTTNYSRYLTPFINYDYNVLAKNVRFFHENNVIGLFEQGNYNGENGEFGEMKAYLLAKLMSDPYMTEEQYYAHMDDFLEGYYGENWREVRSVIDMMITKTNSFHFTIFDTGDSYSLHLRREIDGLVELFEKLEMKSENYGEISRLDRSQMQFEFVWLNRYFK